MPQFTMDIAVEGHGVLNIYYVHKESAIPLLFVHGWPGSVIEARKILLLLTADEPGRPSFHIVALGLPGYGFSEGSKKKGFNVGHKLMQALGYNEYVTQGGDWGALITRAMANEYGGKHIKAWHTNMPVGTPPPNDDPSSYDAEDLKSLERSKWFQEKGNGYFREHATQPQTIGYSLTDSPVDLLAWIYEKLVVWTDAYPWDDDEVLTWISIYWFSRSSAAASVRTYYEVG
ncbi:epoxide hydrolase [Moniliophthora roreri MCA 2997]|uniref:Epoxide hydrolase n=1 Tax=Moniliophthora roreri (strain MCA 2997) TaxID=1381753 RepID=V2WRQ9_MONRO|nr:epoxide hydrolase [Moniliophthora roreri MCA 2997]